jgi:hypothetical protein
MKKQLISGIAAATALVGIVGTTSAANAATLTFTGNVNRDLTDFEETVNLRQFDSSLGTLTGVTVELFGEIDGTAKLENTSTRSGSTVTAELSARLGLTGGPAGSINLNANPLRSIGPVNLARFDGNRDFGGASGTSIGVQPINETRSQNFTSNLDAFIGSGTLPFTFSAVGTSRTTGGGNVLNEFETFARANVRVIYNYQGVARVPEASTTIGMALVAGAGLLLQRKKAVKKA